MSEEKMTFSVRRRALIAQLCRAGVLITQLVVIALVVDLVVFYEIRDARQLEMNRPPFRLVMTREVGEVSRASRCAECPQMGDVITVSIHGSASGLTEIRAFYDDALMASCDRCAALSIKIPSVGRYDLVVVDPDLMESCRVRGARLDEFQANAAFCGVKTQTVHVVVR